MPSINGVEFNAERPSSGAHSKKSQQNTPPGTDINPITRLGINGFQMQLNVVESHLDRYDALVAEFMKQQELILVLRDGWEYHVEALGVQFPDMVIELGEEYRFSVPLISETPYQFSVDEVNVSKSITANNETWSAGDDGTSLATTGTVPAIPDVQVTGGALGGGYSRETNPLSQTDTATYGTNSTSFVLLQTTTFAANAAYGTKINVVGMDIRSTSGGHFGYGKITIQSASLYGGVETDLASWGPQSAVWASFTASVSESGAVNEVLYIRFYCHSDSTSFTAQIKDLDVESAELQLAGITGLTVHNTADTTTVINISNRVLPDMIVYVNADGTGSVVYSDAFSDDVYSNVAYAFSGVTRDAINDELDIADEGYLVYQIDTKYPIIGVPTLTSQIVITAGTPTPQISVDGVTFYDIDTAIVDDIDTIYPLNSAGNLELDGETEIYFRFDCTGAGTVTCSIKSFNFFADTITADAEHPIINIGAANTFKAVQDADSSFECDIDLLFNHRKWAA